MISALFSRLIILTFGILYPAYASYKAVRTKNIKEYVKWMMYWIVFAFFTFFETFTDIFLSWFPFYYEVKIVIVFWLLSPATKGSSTLYRKFVHPMLTKREQEIDDYINQAKERGYSAVLQLGSKSVNYATNVIMQTAIKTIQYATNAEKGRTLVTSQSAHAISNYMHTDETDLPRSNSLNALAITNAEFSEDDDQQFLNHQSRNALRESSVVSSEPFVDKGSARTRKPKSHKESSGVVTRIGKRSAKAQNLEKSNVASAVRSRRKLRDITPEIDVDIE